MNEASVFICTHLWKHSITKAHYKHAQKILTTGHLKYENYLCKNLGGKKEGGACSKGVGAYGTCIFIYHDYSTTPSIHFRYMLLCCSHEPPATAQIKHTVHFNFHTFHTMYILDMVGWGNQLKRYIPIQAQLVSIVYDSYMPSTYMYLHISMVRPGRLLRCQNFA